VSEREMMYCDCIFQFPFALLFAHDFLCYSSPFALSFASEFLYFKCSVFSSHLHFIVKHSC
jgi:hypothetical protein